MRIRRMFFFVFLGMAALACAEDISARWSLESAGAVVGQSLTLTLEVQGTDSFDPPPLSVPGVEIEFRGGGPRNSTSIVSVNGKTTKTVTKSWVGSWTLKSTSVGSYHIDAQNWSIGKAAVFLPALNWQVSAAGNDGRFVLAQRLNRSNCVPGVAIEYTLVWYLGQSAQNPEFTLPILDNPDLVPVESSFTVPPGDTFQIEYRGRVLTGVKSVETLNGQQYTALTLSFSVKPSKPGKYDLSGTMVSFEGAVDTRQSQDFFGNIVNEPVYRPLTAQARPLTLTVSDLPAAGKPNPFSGLIGKLDLSWADASGSFAVGEPIRLTLSLSGVLNMPDLDLDHMVIAALDGNDFQVSPDLSAKEEAGKRGYIFRGRHEGHLVVPPLTINYFDPETRRYGVTATKALSFTVTGPASSSGPTAASGGAFAPSGVVSSSGSPASAPATAASARLARMNPNGLSRSPLPFLPWWAFGIPCFAAGLVFAPAGLWRHSRRRILSRERNEWKKKLGPLSAQGGRAALAEGRLRLQALVRGAGPLWKERLEADGRWKTLGEAARVWDEAFFSEGKDGENWGERWNGLMVMTGGWK